jgi:hypothetical protein
MSLLKKGLIYIICVFPISIFAFLCTHRIYNSENFDDIKKDMKSLSSKIKKAVKKKKKRQEDDSELMKVI